MDIWKWVTQLQEDLQESGHGASAEAIEKLTDLVCDLEIERAEALVPEIRALAKTLDNPWLDVFARHWDMRNRLSGRNEGEAALADAVSFFEFAHRKETMACPQSVCATQDLAACYANVDGPGWSAERIAVCDETLVRIDPSWACFQCLSNEKAEALADAGRCDAALAWLDAQEKAAAAAGEDIFESMREMRVTVLLDMKRNEEALELIRKMESTAAENGFEYRQWSQPRQLKKALALAQLGRDAEAQESLLPFDEIAPFHRMDWLRTAALLLHREPAGNTWQFGRQVQQSLEHYSRVGAHRVVIDAAALGIPLALARGSTWSARRQLKLAQQHLPQLRQDHGANAQLAALAARIDAAPTASPLPAPAGELLAWLDKQNEDQPRNPEQEVEWLLEAVAQRPDDADLRDMAASALRACAATDEAIALLWEDVRAHGGEERASAYPLLDMLLAGGRIEEARRLADFYRSGAPVTALWCEIRCARQLGDWREAEKLCRELLAISPTSYGAQQILAQALMAQERFAEAADVFLALSEKSENPNNLLWDHMTAASAAGDWAAVRQSARRLELDLEAAPEDAPIEENRGWVIIRYQEDGEERDYYATRTGPVTARIQELAPDNLSQHFSDWVVFDATPLYPVPEDEEERKNFTPTYGLVHRLEAGGFAASWTVDGVYPGDEIFDALRDRAAGRGWRIWVRSSDEYRLQDKESGATDLPGIFFLIAQPEGQPPRELNDFLAEACRDWPHRWCWPRLAEACGEAVQPHFDLIERYGL
ncbi:MAG: hypothetical protein LBE62_15875 [Azonexus sp.]|jgi:tetratricopeptide (TPR) repeat protein|nr:hypothetical protein [Azonexus sp.]